MLIVDKDNFDAEVLSHNGPVLVDFWGPKCEPCKELMPQMEELEKVYGDRVKFCKLDTSANRRLAISQKVLGLPTIAIYKNGSKVDEVTQNVTIEMVEDMIKRNL
ncbi:MAG: thioredoxin domain-containing protein [Thermoanaerobacteraceae bacterium]|nr:thioredoxin domain-containing protein [Thermoanaerobacteraceae bacterium]